MMRSDERRGGAAAVRSHGPGPFITHRHRRLSDGTHLVALSRRHRKGLRPHCVADVAIADRAPDSHASAFRHLWAPTRLAWWIAVLFLIGSSLFALGGAAATWPELAPTRLRDASVLGRVFVVGAVFFTGAAWLQWLESLNGDVAEALAERDHRPWRWFGWRPRNLGYLASAVQLVGTLLFNVDTLDATRAGLSWVGEDLFVWSPDMLGCVCFLVASGLAYAEVSPRITSIAPRSLSWWITVVNLLGSVAFQISALYGVVLPGSAPGEALHLSNLYTALGGLCFFVASYLMIPELFDEAAPAAANGDASGDGAISDRRRAEIVRPACYGARHQEDACEESSICRS